MSRRDPIGPASTAAAFGRRPTTVKMLGTERKRGGRHVRTKLCGRCGPGQDDGGPRLVQRRGERDRVAGRANLIGDRGKHRRRLARLVTGEPAVGESFLDDDDASRLARLGKSRPGRRFERVPGRLDAAEKRHAVGGDF